ncbi:MAG: ABC transporter substrate-binding protein [Armatimonadota bacterium]
MNERTGRGLHAAAVSVLAAALTVVLMTHVAGADDLSEMGPRTNLQVTLWETEIPGEKAALQELIFSFQRANPDVIVCLEWQDAELQDEWTRRWFGGQRHYAPDVTVVTERRAWENRHELLEMPDDFGRELRGEYQRSVMRRLPGQARGVPWSVRTYALYYRADLLAEAELSPPETLEELVECAEALADPPACFGLGIPQPFGGGEELVHALAQAAGSGGVAGDGDDVDGDGGEAGDAEAGDAEAEDAEAEDAEAEDAEAEDAEAEDAEAGNAEAGNAEAGNAEAGDALGDGDREREGVDHAAALEMLVDLQSRGALQPETLTWTDGELVELFVDGRLAMIIAPISAARMLRGADEPPEWASVPLPMAEDGSGHLSVDWMVAFADTDRREQAVRLLRYMAEAESQRMLAMLPSVPAMRRLAAELGDRAPWQAHLAHLDDAEGLPLARWERLRPQLGEALIYAMSGRLTAREALARAAEAGG